MTVTDQIRDACRTVAANALAVRIDANALARYAPTLPLEKAIAPTLDRATHYVADEAGTLAYFLILDAINFGSGYFPHLAKRPGMSGYFTVANALKDEFDKTGPIPAQRLAELTAADCARIFGQDPANTTVTELMNLFA